MSSAICAAWPSDEQARESSQLSLSTAHSVMPFGCACDSSMVHFPWLAACLPESRDGMELGGTACTKQRKSGCLLPEIRMLLAHFLACRMAWLANLIAFFLFFFLGPGGRAALATVTVILLAKTLLCTFPLSRHFHMFCRAGAAGAVSGVSRGVAGGPRRGSGGRAGLRDAAPPDRRAPAAPL